MREKKKNWVKRLLLCSTKQKEMLLKRWRETENRIKNNKKDKNRQKYAKMQQRNKNDDPEE